ncbi:MAG TPA: ACT domain-containing protein [Alphaproteobacteria bacterium]|nr:ACT domain-containing protein [Alphaproteobacteria bacterium]
MAASIIFTAIGSDRPGLVRALSEKVAASGGNWLESRMAHLAGQFAGIVLVSVPEPDAEALITSLRELETLGLHLTIERGLNEVMPPTPNSFKLEVMGHDHPGIVRDIARALEDRGVNIEELATEIVKGSWSGTSLFRATALLRTPGELKIAELRDVLERLAGDLTVEISLDDVPKSAGTES